MIINNITGDRYATRKEAKSTLGHANFNKMVRNREFTFTLELPEITDIIL